VQVPEGHEQCKPPVQLQSMALQVPPDPPSGLLVETQLHEP
jgi:hypothetical protein